jgi:O-succinylbenzoic acid--CoA ligase
MPEWLRERARVTPSKVALWVGERHWTYQALDQLVELCSQQLSEAGIGAGSIVAVLMPNSVGYVALVHALARLESVLLPLNTRLTKEELAWQLAHCGCSLLICDDSTAATAAALPATVLQLDSTDTPSLTQLKTIGGQSKVDDQHPENLQSIIFTSGTTGRPKGVMLTFDNHFWSATASSYRLGLAVNDLWLSCLPLYHVGGLAIIFRSCLYGTAVDLHSRFDVETVSDRLDKLPVTLISLVPTMVNRLLDYRRGRPWSDSMRHVLVGGAATTPALAERCQALGIPLATTYGLTEASSQVATQVADDVWRKPGSVGKPLMFGTVRILNDAGNACQPEEIGEIHVSGPNVMAGYYGNPEANQRTLVAGELRTGDLGYLDRDGDLWLVQRRSDLIVSGGENIYPAEVERVLSAHPAVVAVCVVGIPNTEWGQQPSAMVQLSPGSQVDIAELERHCRQSLAGYKVPRIWQLVAALPQTGSGKVHRQEVREILLQLQSNDPAAN